MNKLTKLLLEIGTWLFGLWVLFKDVVWGASTLWGKKSVE